MTATISDEIHRLGQSLLDGCSKGEDIGVRLAQAFAPLLAPHFHVGFVSVVSPSGEVLIEKELLVYAGGTKDSSKPAESVIIERVAGIIYATNRLAPDSLREGYERIGALKSIARPPKPDKYPGHDVPFGAIIACEADRALEEIVDLMAAINAKISSTQWPDLVSVLSRGVINYAVQFEGGGITGDFLLPNESGFSPFAMYVHVMVSSLSTYTFNRTCGYLFMHLGCFGTHTSLPTNEIAAAGAPRSTVNTIAYMFNLAHFLVPAPDEMRQDHGYGLSLLPYRVEDQEGKLISRVQYVPWLDGAAIRIYGNLPLLPFISLLGKLSVRIHQMKTKDGKISSVLPIQRPQFETMLMKLRRQSNFIIKQEEPSWTWTKMADEGTSSPFMARLFLNVLHLSKCALVKKADTEAFEKPYQLVLMSSITVRDLVNTITQLITEHRRKVAAGLGARIAGRSVHIDEPIDKELRKDVEAFLNSANRVMLTGMKEAAKALGLDITFFFKKDSTFATGVAQLATIDPDLAEYCRKARVWSDTLNSIRNEMEHNFWSLPHLQYKPEIDHILIIEPEVQGKPLLDFVGFISDRMLCFIEDVCVQGLKRRLPDNVSITEIPRDQRPTERPERFRLCTAGGGLPLWKIYYHESKFDET